MVLVELVRLCLHDDGGWQLHSGPHSDHRRQDDRTLEGNDGVIKQLDITVDRLPANGHDEGTVFDLDVENDTFVDINYQLREMNECHEAVQEWFDWLLTRLNADKNEDKS